MDIKPKPEPPPAEPPNSLIPRRLLDADEPNGYLESDKDYVLNNLALAVHLLDRSEVAGSRPSAPAPSGGVTCMNCGQKFAMGTTDFDKHECPVKLTELERDAMAVMLHATFCDHYCCGMTKEVCRAKGLIQSLKDHGYEMRESAPAPSGEPQAKWCCEGNGKGEHTPECRYSQPDYAPMAIPESSPVDLKDAARNWLLGKDLEMLLSGHVGASGKYLCELLAEFHEPKREGK